jgi:phosphoglucosamine mutase
MQEKDYSIGGEQSGHIIMRKYATTGDGLLTAIMVTEEICDSKSTLSSLVKDVAVYPQYLKNVRVTDKDAVMNDKNVLASVKEAEALINGNGRVLLRQSGTEPLIRVMVEAETEEKCHEYAEIVVKAIIEGGHAIG